jgi:hypothetical protein
MAWAKMPAIENVTSAKKAPTIPPWFDGSPAPPLELQPGSARSNVLRLSNANAPAATPEKKPIVAKAPVCRDTDSSPAIFGDTFLVGTVISFHRIFQNTITNKKVDPINNSYFSVT